MERKKRYMKIETRPTHTTPDNDLGGIYQYDVEQYRIQQEEGKTMVPLEKERTYQEDAITKRKPDSAQQEKQRVMRMSVTGKDGEPIALHYQRDWQMLNYKGLNHEVIHLAVTTALKRAGFLSEAAKILRSDEGIPYDDEWPETARTEEVIVDALERAGIREGKITERFWDYLEEEAARQCVPVPEVTPEILGKIAEEIDVIASKNLEGDDQYYPLP